MKKKKIAALQSEEAVSDAGQAYVVGLVSGSLGAKQTPPSSGALSSLFSTASSNTVVFVPAQKAKPQASPVKQDSDQVHTTKEAPKHKTAKEKSIAEKTLQNREGALKNADDEDQVEKSPKKVKRKLQKDDKETEEEAQLTKKQKIKRNMALERIKGKRTVFVGNLPVNYQKKNVKKIFKDLGVIESVRFRSVVQEDPTMSRRLATIRRQVDPKSQNINAYVVFKDEEGAANALQRNGMEVEKDIYIRVDRVAKNTHPHKRSIFVGNLPYDISELPLRQHFKECGEVEAVRLIRDRNSGMGKGFGYVLFESADSVMLALKLNGSELLSRKIRIMRSVKKEKEKQVSGPDRRNAKKLKGKGDEKRKGAQPGHFKSSKSAPGQKGNRPAEKFFKKNPGKGNKTSTSFTGEMTDPNVKKGKGQKKKFKHKKTKRSAHI
ncbi:RNA-binding protein 34 [Astyanax mexicanus]|uniref:RNA-binding protein 34 n=1 Tax=Astyanax mexicanus TaxID=7994 RepID=UPI0020CB5969|nr:RNA-binding protein 34 [Astyanax mexicanus]